MNTPDILCVTYRFLMSLYNSLQLLGFTTKSPINGRLWHFDPLSPPSRKLQTFLFPQRLSLVYRILFLTHLYAAWAAELALTHPLCSRYVHVVCLVPMFADFWRFSRVYLCSAPSSYFYRFLTVCGEMTLVINNCRNLLSHVIEAGAGLTAGDSFVIKFTHKDNLSNPIHTSRIVSGAPPSRLFYQ